MALSARYQLEHIARPIQYPCHGHICICAIIETAVLFEIRTGIPGVILIGAHDASDLVAIDCGIVRRCTSPETRDLKYHLGAVEVEKLIVISRLVILPDVIDDRGIDVALPKALIGYPTAR